MRCKESGLFDSTIPSFGARLEPFGQTDQISHGLHLPFPDSIDRESKTAQYSRSTQNPFMHFVDVRSRHTSKLPLEARLVTADHRIERTPGAGRGKTFAARL